MNLSDVTRVFVRESINKLETREFKNDLIIDCLLSIKEQNFDENQITNLLERIVLNCHVEWVSSSYSKTLMLEVLKTISPDLNILLLSSLIYKLSAGTRLEFVVSVLEELFRIGNYKSLLERECATSSSPSCVWDKLVSCIASLPDHIANKFKNNKSFSLFHHENFFIFLGVQIAEVVEFMVGRVNDGCHVNTQFIAKNIGHFCLIGKSEQIFKPLYPMLVSNTKTSHLWQGIVQKLIFNVSDRCLEPVLVRIFKDAPTPHCIPRILGDVVVEKSKAKFIILHKFLFTRSSNDTTIPQNVISYIATSESNNLFMETLHKLLNIWGSTSSIKRTSYEQHRYITTAILVAVPYLTSELQQKYKNDLLTSLMPGIKNHLESPDDKIRVIGMIVGEKLSDVIKLPTENNSKLEFEFPINDEVTTLSSLCKPVIDLDQDFYKNQQQIFKKIKSDTMKFDHGNPENETSFTAAKRTFIEMAKIQNISLTPQDVTKDEHEECVDSDDDLAPYDLPNEVPFSKIPKPTYIRDCMEGIINNKDRDHMTVYLTNINYLIETDVTASREIAVELCKVLLNLQDCYSLENFNEIRRTALTSVVICNPEPVSEYVASQFYDENYNLQQRIDMLDVLVMAAGRLSGIERRENSNATLISEVEEVSELSWQQVIERRIENKTRRFGKRRKQPVASSPDRFGPVSGFFFYPLMAGYDKRIRTMNMLERDTIVLVRLLYALGTILYAASHSTNAGRMGKSLLEFVTQSRRHSESFVRKACIYCVTMTTVSVTSLTQGIDEAALEARDWLCGVIEHDDDTKVKQLAANALMTLDDKLRQELNVNKT